MIRDICNMNLQVIVCLVVLQILKPSRREVIDDADLMSLGE
jgi:hypothetical protein